MAIIIPTATDEQGRRLLPADAERLAEAATADNRRDRRKKRVHGQRTADALSREQRRVDAENLYSVALRYGRPVMSALPESEPRRHAVMYDSTLNQPRDTTLVDFMETGRNLRRGEYGKVFNTALATVSLLGMFARAKPSQAKRADRLLGGRPWESLSRTEKLAIRDQTGLEKLGGEWVSYVRDPSYSANVTKQFRYGLTPIEFNFPSTRLNKILDLSSVGQFDPSVGEQLGETVVKFDRHVPYPGPNGIVYMGSYTPRHLRYGDQGLPSYLQHYEPPTIMVNTTFPGTLRRIIHEGQHRLDDVLYGSDFLARRPGERYIERPSEMRAYANTVMGRTLDGSGRPRILAEEAYQQAVQDWERESDNPQDLLRSAREYGVFEDAKGGDEDRFAMSRNFLATDEVPDSIFGIPIVSDSDDYTPEDIAFFHSHPEAGGYYDLGEGTPEDGSAEGAPVQADAPRRKPEETFDTPIPKELRARYGAWYAQLPERLQYTGDYDLQGAWLERLGRPDKYEASQDGHLDDYGKKPNHITFSTGSKWHDPKVPERTGGEWRRAKDGSWDFYPGPGNKASDDELKAYFDKYERGNRVHKRETREANGTGKTKRKIPPIVKGPLHYGPPPPPSRGPYPGISNNPGNVEKHERRSDDTLFKGEIAGGVRPKRFAVFDSPVNGLNAAAVVLSRRAAELRKAGKPFTIENYAPRYAPPTENDTEAYIQNLSKYSGIARDAAIDLSNAADMKNLLKTVVRFESGEPHSAWFTDDEYDRAVRQVEPNRGDTP